MSVFTMYSSHYNINLDMILLYRITQTAPGGDLPATNGFISWGIYKSCGLMGYKLISCGLSWVLYIYLILYIIILCDR